MPSLGDRVELGGTMMTRYVLTVLLSMLPATASSLDAEVTLTAEPAVARPGGSIQLLGTGFGSCRDPDASKPIDIVSNRPGIATLSFRGTPGGEFRVSTSVSDDPAPGPHTITASCGAAGPEARATVIVEVDDDPAAANPGVGGDDTAGGATSDEPAATASPTTAGGNEPTPAQTPTATQPTASDTAARWPLVGLALALLAVVGLGVRRLFSPSPPVVDVRTVTGVVVGPGVRRSTSRHDGVRIVTHADPGTRTVSTRSRDGGTPT